MALTTDSSTNNLTVTANGDVALDTATYKYDGGSASFDGTGDYLFIDDNELFGFGTGDFTIEAWVYPTALQNDLTTIIDFRSGDGANGPAIFIVTSSSQILFYNGSDNSGPTTTTSIELNTWTHIAAQRSNGEWSVYINGIKDEVTEVNSGNLLSSRPCRIGTAADNPGSYRNFTGYIDDLRVIKGVGIYSDNFTPTKLSTPYDEYFNNVSLLLHMDGSNGSQSFTDSSLNNLSVTANGDVNINTSTKKFGSGAAYFDGDGDYLSFNTNNAFDFGSEDWTIEFWYLKAGDPEPFGILFKTADINDYGGAGIALNFEDAGNDINCSISYNGDANDILLEVIGTVSDSEWRHFAIIRNGSTLKTYQNGIETASANIGSNSIYYNPSDIIIIGGGSLNNKVNGYIDELRITKGVARYTENFVPQTAPFANVGLPFPTDGLLAFWKLDDFTDSSVNGNDLTGHNGVTFESGLIGDCARTAWGNDGSYLTSDLSVNGDATLSMWFKWDSLPIANPGGFQDRYPLVVQKYPTFCISTNSNYPRKLFLSDMATWTGDPSTFEFTVGEWCHIVTTFENGHAKVYANGVLILETPEGHTNGLNSGGRLLGWGGDNVDAATSYGTDTQFDAIGIWNRVLTQTEIATLYNNGNGREL